MVQKQKCTLNHSAYGIQTLDTSSCYVPYNRNEISLLPKTPTDKKKRQMRRFIGGDRDSFDRSLHEIRDRDTLHSYDNCVKLVQKELCGTKIGDSGSAAQNIPDAKNELVSHMPLSVDAPETRNDSERKKYILSLRGSVGEKASRAEHSHR